MFACLHTSIYTYQSIGYAIIWRARTTPENSLTIARRLSRAKSPTGTSLFTNVGLFCTYISLFCTYEQRLKT